MLLDQWPAGDYRLFVGRQGLATARGRVRCTGNDRLTASSWVGPIALFSPPGLAQFWREERWRGLEFLATGTVGGTELVRQEADRRDAVHDVERASVAYANAISEQEIATTRADLQAATERKQDTKELRSLWTGYLAAVWAGAALDAWLLSPEPTLHAQGEGRYLLGVPRAGAWQAGWRSFLVPGSGQQYLGRSWRGNLFSAGVMGLAAGTLSAHESFLHARRDQDDAQRRYDAAETEADLERWRIALDRAANEASDRNVVRWSLVAATGGAYLWNVIDAMTLGHESAQESDVNYAVAPRRDGLVAVVTWRLP